MKKTLLVIFLMLLLSASLVEADTVDDLAGLARYFPAETPLYISLYISDEAIANWETAIRQIMIDYGANPDDRYTQTPLRAFLDDFVRENDENGSFASVYRPWLGNTLAFGALTPETLAFGSRGSTGESSILFVADVTDHDAAEAHMDSVINSGRGLFSGFEDYEKTVENDYILYHPSESQEYETTFMLVEDAMFIRFSSVEVESLLPEFEQSLAEVPAFEESLRRLPLERYEIVGYFDPSSLAPYAEDYDAEIRVNTILPDNADTAAALEALGAQSFGFGFVDKLSVTLDWATHVDDPAALAEAGVDIVISPPVDLALARSLPSSTKAFIQDTGMGLGMMQVLYYFKAMGAIYSQFSEEFGSDFQDDYFRALSFYDEMALVMLVSFSGLMEQLPDSMQGQHILYSTSDSFMNDPRTLGLLLEISDSAEALSLLPTILADSEVAIQAEELDGGLNIPLTEEAEEDFIIRVEGLDNYLQFGFDESMIDLNEGGTLGEDEAYLRAEELFVPNPQIIGYVDTSSSMYSFNVVESVSMSTTWDEQGTGHIRFMTRIARN
jgi:hypothetical protein